MRDTESRALRRAVLILLVVSSVRWASGRADAPATPGEDVLDTLVQASRAAADDARARAEPLAAGERIDPNRADEIQLDRLPGVGPATARAILAAREQGTVFREPEDLLEVRGLGPAAVSRLGPLMDLDDPPVGAGGSGLRAAPRPAPNRAGGRGGASREGPLVDLNRAAPGELETLPGIGPELAKRIVAEREKRLFSSLDDLVRVPGVGPATVARMRGLAVVGGIS